MISNYSNPIADLNFHQLLKHPEKFPFYFIYQGVGYSGFSSDSFICQSCETVFDSKKETTTQIFSFRDSLTVTLVSSFYPAYGASEWTVWFENTGTENSGVLEKLVTKLIIPGKHPVLKGIMGDHVNHYRPYAHSLEDIPIDFSSDSGRATHINFPYFNLENDNGGVMLAIGWAGTWHASFEASENGTVYTGSAVNNAKTYLKPGEKIRSALFAVAPYTVRSEHYATNYWRSWFVNCNLPVADACENKLEPFSTCALSHDTGLPNSDGSISERYFTWKPSLEKMIEEDVKVDFRWFDAGWYVAPDGSSPESDWWGTVGTWELDPAKWPDKTFLESTDFARANGMKTLMWFEPERVTDPESLAKNYGYDLKWAIRMEGIGAISNNIGDPECLKWTTERICRMLRENKVEMYREDNNSDPAILWKYLDSREGDNRSGITEYKFIMAHYQMWDDIIACTLSYGGCGFVDSCASGGGRNDLESLRRGIPLLRSDADRTTTALRLSMTTAFNKWVPFCGANTKEKRGELDATGDSDPYIWRASYLASLNVDSQFVQDPDQDFSILRNGLKEWKKVCPYLLKDFYTLTPWHFERDTSDFTAYSYFDPKTEKGVILAFRMENCIRSQLSLCLPYVKDGVSFRLTDEDSGEELVLSGNRLNLTFNTPRTAKLIWIEACK